MNPEFENGLKAITRSSTSFTSDIGCYILESGGKRLRPRLVMMIAEAIGMAEKDILPLAYTVELLHTASLLHDDVVDATEMRRSKPTANQVYGDRPALLAGDYIFASALELTCNLDNMRVALSMVDTIKKMTEGELKELEHVTAFHRDVDVYLDIIYLKTASLFEFCTQSPGVIGRLDEDKIAALTTYGRSLGMAFQIVDDIIDLTPDTKTNKDAFNDVVEGKSTLPLIHLFNDNPGMMDELSAETDGDKRRALVRSRMTPEILGRSSDMAREYCDTALNELARVGVLTDALGMIPGLILEQLKDKF